MFYIDEEEAGLILILLNNFKILPAFEQSLGFDHRTQWLNIHCYYVEAFI